MSDNFWDEVEKTIEDQSGGGGGIVALTSIQLGYKVYANNDDLAAIKKTQADTFFPANKKDEVKSAEAAAKALAEKLGPDAKGNDRRASYGVMITCAKLNAITSKQGEWQDVTWKEDRQMFEPLWKSKKNATEQSDGYKVVVPALKTLGKTPPIKSWMHLTFAKAPSGKTKNDQQGQPQPALICYPVKLFADEKSAKAEVTSGKNGNGASEVSVPNGYNATSWANMAKTIKQYAAKPEAPKKQPALIAWLIDQVVELYDNTNESITPFIVEALK